MEKELRKKIIAAMTENFVGNYIFTDEELTTLYDEASHALRGILGEWGVDLSYSDYELIFVALVNLAKKWNSGEEAFFDFIYRKLLGSNTAVSKIYNQIVNIIKYLSNNKKIYMLNCYKKKYYATICSHSFAPISSIESFFDMCWDIYCKDMYQQYLKNDPVFKLIANSLKNKFILSTSNEDEFQIGSNVYSFRAGIKGLIIDEPELTKNLIEHTIYCIHCLFNNEPLKIEKYIDELINIWWKKKESTFGFEKIRNNITREKVCTDYSQLKPKYILEDGVAKLIIPPIRLLDNYDYDPYIDIYLNNVLIRHDIMETRGSGIIMTTYPIEYELSLFEHKNLNIRIEISHCHKIIYNSKDSLNREFILFNDSKEIMSIDCLPGIYILYAKNIDLLLKYPSDIHRIALNTYSLESFEGEMIQSENKTIFFVTEQSNRDLYFFAKERNDVIFKCNDEEFKVIDGELYIDVLKDININDFGIRYESVIFKLSEFPNTIINGKRRYLISSLLNVGETQHISIFKYSENTIIAKINLIKFNNIKITFDKLLYYGLDVIGEARFTTDKYELKREFDTSCNELSIPLEDGEIILYPPILRWKIDDGEWQIDSNKKGIWYKKLTNSSIITFDIPKSMSYNVHLNVNESIEQIGNSFSYKIGRSIYALKDNINIDQNYFTVFISMENQNYLITYIYYRENFTEEPIFIIPKLKQIFWLPEMFIGDDDARFRFDIIDKNDQCVFSKELNLSKQNFLLSDIEEGYYTYNIILLCKGFLKKEKNLYSKKIVLGDERNIKYKNKVFLINRVSLFDKFEPQNIRNIYIDNIKYLGNKENYDFYSGKLFVIDQEGKKIYFNTMKNETNNKVKINPIRIEIKSQNSCYIGYGLNPYDKDFEYDDEFLLDNQRKITIGRKGYGQKTKGIDYFLFEVINNV